MFQAEWARPPSTPSADGSGPVITVTKPGQWNPTQTTTTYKPSSSRPSTSKPTTSIPVSPSNDIDEGCTEDFLPHIDCSKVFIIKRITLIPNSPYFQYYRCAHGQKMQFDCKPGTVYHTISHICDWPVNADRDECRKV